MIDEALTGIWKNPKIYVAAKKKFAVKKSTIVEKSVFASTILYIHHSSILFLFLCAV